MSQLLKIAPDQPRVELRPAKCAKCGFEFQVKILFNVPLTVSMAWLDLVRCPRRECRAHRRWIEI